MMVMVMVMVVQFDVLEVAVELPDQQLNKVWEVAQHYTEVVAARTLPFGVAVAVPA
jgi:hypothetical protein